MVRAERLLFLLQVLRRHKRPVSGAQLAQELGISIRTLYRDIASLQAQGADIQGEPGVGYILKPSFMLPPLMFSQAELEALLLGFRWVEKLADPSAVQAALEARAKISAVLPDSLKDSLDSTALRVGPRQIKDAETIDLGIARAAIRFQDKLRIRYVDGAGKQSDRVIWPFALGYFEHFRILVGWCELKGQFRHFRTDRIRALTRLDTPYPIHRAKLFTQWRETQKGTDYVPDT